MAEHYSQQGNLEIGLNFFRTFYRVIQVLDKKGKTQSEHQPYNSCQPHISPGVRAHLVGIFGPVNDADITGINLLGYGCFLEPPDQQVIKLPGSLSLTL